MALEAVPRLAERLARSGLDAVFVNGTTGEWPSLTEAERLGLLEAWAAALEGRDLPWIAHAGDPALPAARLLAARAAELGAVAVAACPPSFQRPPDTAALVDWCARVAEAAGGLPFLYYHIPSLSGVAPDLVAFALEACRRVPAFAGFKYTDGDLESFQRLRDLEGLTLYWGFDESLLAGLVLGADGAVGSTWNLVPAWGRAILEAASTSRREEALRLQRRQLELVDLLRRDGFLPSLKAALEFQGLPAGPPRVPLRPLGAGARRRLLCGLQDLGVPGFEAGPPP